MHIFVVGFLAVNATLCLTGAAWLAIRTLRDS
jgi:hypothetical protein